jgi:hypothetical protein
MPPYQFPNQRYTSQLGLALYGMDEVLAENMLLIDGTFGAGSTVNVNGALVANPNFNGTTPAAPISNTNVTFQTDINGNVSAYVPSAIGFVKLNPTSDQTIVGSYALNIGTVGGSDAAVLEVAGSGVVPVGIAGGNNTLLYLNINHAASPWHILMHDENANSSSFGVLTADVNGRTRIEAFNATNAPGLFLEPSTNTWSLTGFNHDSIRFSKDAAILFSNAGVAGTDDVSLGRLSTAVLGVGTGAINDFSGTLKLTILNAVTGIQINGGATSGNVLRGNGTNFVSAQLQYSDIGGTVPAGAWSSLTGTLSNGQVIPYADAGISRLGAASLALGNGTSGDLSGSLTLRTIVLQGVSTNSPTYVSEQRTVTAGGTTTAGLLVSTAATGNVQTSDLAATDVFGVAITSQTSGQLVSVARIGIVTAIADNTVTTDNILGVGTVTAGRVKDLGSTSSLGVSSQLSVVGKALSSATAGGSFTMQIYGPGFYGGAGAAAAAAWATLTGVLSNGQVIPYGDSGLSRLAAGSLAVGNGTASDVSGTLTMKHLIVNDAAADTAVTIAAANNSTNFLSFALTATPATPVWTMYLNSGALVFYSTGPTIAFKPTAVVVGSPESYAWASSGDAGAGSIDTNISRISAGVVGIGTGAQGSIAGNLSYNRINTAGADHAGQATVTAGQTTKAVAFAANYTGTGQPVVVLTPTSDPLALGVPVGYWVTYSGGAGAWTGFTVSIQTALVGNVTFNYVVIGVA